MPPDVDGPRAWLRALVAAPGRLQCTCSHLLPRLGWEPSVCVGHIHSYGKSLRQEQAHLHYKGVAKVLFWVKWRPLKTHTCPDASERDLIWKWGFCRWNRVKMRSQWTRGALNPMTGILLRGERHTETQTLPGRSLTLQHLDLGLLAFRMGVVVGFLSEALGRVLWLPPQSQCVDPRASCQR